MPAMGPKCSARSSLVAKGRPKRKFTTPEEKAMRSLSGGLRMMGKSRRGHCLTAQGRFFVKPFAGTALLCFRFGRRQSEEESAAFADGAFCPDAAAVLLDDAAAERQAEAGASERA